MLCFLLSFAVLFCQGYYHDGCWRPAGPPLVIALLSDGWNSTTPCTKCWVPSGSPNLIERSIIEVAPLAFMRGRTLNDSFIILDEAQNTTVEQMKMFLTRIGFGSTAVVTGDVT